MDNVTIARSRNHIKKYYNTEKIGNFPERLKPISIREKLTDLKGAVNYREIYQTLNNLTLAVYTPSNYILMSALSKYDFEDNRKKKNLTQQGRETGVKRLMQKNLLKRLESSVYSFEITITKVKSYIDFIIDKINNLDKNSLLNFEDFNNDDFDLDDQNTDFFIIGKKVKFDLKDMDYISWKRELEEDSENLALLISMIKDIEPKYDNKLQKLLKLIDEKIKNPINENNKKVIIFTAFADTAKYLYDNIADYILKKYGLNTAMVTGSIDEKTTIKGLKADLDKVLTLFSPISKGKDINNEQEIDILIATDCISEGQNLQDCDYLINYDIHWNPVRIIQRFGRIDRIGSKNKVIQLVNYWPDINLDEYINLKARVESRMKISIMTSTGDDDLINQEEKGDLEYRRNQLKKLQEEVVDLEDINGGISIMDLGLNDFRLDLIAYLKDYKNPDKIPMGLHSVISKKDDLKPGVIFILKNLNKEIDVNKQNYIHPFYMVYISNESEVLINHLAIKDLLDTLRFLCKNKKDTDKEAVKLFNKETKDGHKMNKYSELLSSTIKSIIEVKNENEIDAIISGKDFSFFAEQIDGLDDFELICFLVVE
ncbi:MULTISPECIES: C-terminal helicase domain-containing protein [Fusobacterium]|uniref:C-terminal helicase domain-containing protein n=1 Tax=Fusobacterium TaxID=848 RepID=UPI00045187DA|nr:MULTISPECIES: helicase-related protein [Fusobacterium]EUB34495.1 helicase C-terminal domain protein [Fusobacterium sp. OBRC1]WRL72937.1 helicase-related protein [Fusobacterium polymorphum]